MATTNQANADVMNNDVLNNLLGTATPTDNTPALSGIRIIDQPLEVRLRYNTSFHAEILSKLNARQMLAERNISSRWADWDRVDEHVRLFIDLRRGVKNADGSTNTNKREMPWNRAIVIPMSYAILQTYLTQMMAIFTRRDPIIEVSGVGPEDIRPAKVMQAVLAYDQRQTQFLVQLYSLLQSAVKYGFGKMYDCWEETWGWKFTKRPADPFADYLGQPQVDRSWDVLKQHNMVESIDPRLTWHDPRVSVAFEQRAEFAGHRVFCSYLDLLEKSQANGGPYFNIEYVAKLGAGGVARRDTTIARTLKHLVMTGSMDDKDKGFHCKDIMSIRLIPKDWKLGDGERPEYWQFAWVDKTVVIRAHLSQYHHNQHPYSGAESNVDPHMTFNPGAIENLDGLARFANWMYNSHTQNVMRHLNNSMLYAPTLIEELDVLNPTAGGHYRLSAIGEKLLQEGRITLDQAIHQLQKTDVTTGMLAEVNHLYDMGMRMSGAADTMQAQVTEDKRTATEINQATMGGNQRMAFYTGLMDAMAIAPTATRMISNEQQFRDIPAYFRIAGDLAREMGADRMLVTPDDLAGNLDYVQRSGPMAPDPSDMIPSWQALSEMLTKNPGLLTMPDSMGKVVDPVELFKEYARGPLSIRNIDSYFVHLIQMQQRMMAHAPQQQVMADEQVEQQRRQGNIIPFRQAG